MIIPYFTQYNSTYLSSYNTGLGNALFQIFTSYGLSKEYNHMLNLSNLKKLIIILKKWGLKHNETIYRNISNYFISCPNKFNKKSINIKERHNYYSLYDDILDSVISKTTNDVEINLFGYLQSYLYFDKYYNDICNILEPDSESLLYIKDNYSHLFDNEILNISCHLRVNWGCNISYDCNFNYCYDAIDYIISNNTEKKYSKIYINIFSDCIDKIKHKIEANNSNDSIKFIYFENNYDYIDLWCMTLCNHNILSNSTLSWWGAYLNLYKNKIVTYPIDILRLVGGTIYKTPMLINRTIQHYKSDWIPIKTQNVIYQ